MHSTFAALFPHPPFGHLLPVGEGKNYFNAFTASATAVAVMSK